MSTEMTTLDVIIPSLPGNPYCDTAIDSVLAQNTDTLRVRAIVVEDGPASEVAEVRPGVHRVFTGARQGSGAATNLGLRLSSAQFIARHDADDVSLQGRLHKQVQYLIEHPRVVLVGGGGFLIDEKGVRFGRYPGAPVGDVRAALTRRNVLVHSTFVMRRADLVAAGGYDERFIRMQDYELALRLALRGEVHRMPDELIEYRVHSGQTSRRASGMASLLWRVGVSRSRLSRELGLPTLHQCAANLAYSGAQVLRYTGLRSPRYVTRKEPL